MGKYSLAFQKAIVKEVLDNGKTMNSVSKEYCIGKVTVQRWVAFYKAYGEEGLQLRHRKYTGDFKVHVVRYIYEHKITCFKAAILFKIPADGYISDWERIYRLQGEDALRNLGSRRQIDYTKVDIPGMKKEESKDLEKYSEKELRKEVEYLRAENAYLKKLDALIQEKEKQAKKTK